MTLLKTSALVSFALTLAACGQSTETTPPPDSPDTSTQAELTAEENDIIRSDNEIEDLARAPSKQDEETTAKSVYSNLKFENCEVVETSEESSSKTYKCAGYKEWDIYARDADGRFTLSAGQAPDFLLQRQPFNSPGDKIEWRLKDGEPHALIYRLNLQDPKPEGAGDSVLVVASLPAGGQSGCAQALVKAGSHQTKAARRYADMINGSSDCPNDPAILDGN